MTRKSFRKSLSDISEEEPIDIGNELDCYQLELENSINEAKIRKDNLKEIRTAHECNEVRESFDNLSGIEELSDEDDIMESKSQYPNDKELQNKSDSGTNFTNSFGKDKKDLSTHSQSENDFSFDNGVMPAGNFVRAYRKPVTVPKQDELENQSNGSVPMPESKNRFSRIIRKSIRKFLRSSRKYDSKKISKENQHPLPQFGEQLINRVRHSVRRKFKQKSNIDSEIVSPSSASQSIDGSTNTLNDISIITDTKRTIFRAVDTNFD